MFDDPRRYTNRQGVRRYVLGHYGACPGVGAVPNLDRGNQAGIHTYESLLAYGCRVLLLAVVVGSDCACADVGFLPYGGVAYEAEMAHLDAALKGGRLHFREVAQVDVLGQVGARANVAVWSHRHAALQRAAL